LVERRIAVARSRLDARHGIGDGVGIEWCGCGRRDTAGNGQGGLGRRAAAGGKPGGQPQTEGECSHREARHGCEAGGDVGDVGHAAVPGVAVPVAAPVVVAAAAAMPGVAAPVVVAAAAAVPGVAAPGVAARAESFARILCLRAAASSYTAMAYRALWL